MPKKMLDYPFPLRPQEMTVPQLDKFRNYMLGDMTPEQEEKFYNELAEDKKNRKRGRETSDTETPLLDEEEMEIMKKSKIYEDDEETTSPLLDEEEMEIMKQSKVFERDEDEKPKTPLEKKEKEMDIFKDANIDIDEDDFLKELDYEGEGGKRRNKTHKGGRRGKHNKRTKKHNKKSKTHKKRKMHKKRKTHIKRRL